MGEFAAATTVRHRWMYRVVALLFLFFGAAWLWRFGFTDYRADLRPHGLAAGFAAIVVAVSLWRLRRWAIGVSAVALALVGVSAAVFAPSTRGPAILFLAALALACIVYAGLAAREVFTARHGSAGA